MEITTAQTPFFGLAQLIAPFDLQEFLSEHWERKHLLLQREDPGYYRELLTLADLDHILTVSNFRADNTRVVIDGKETPISELLGGMEDEDRHNALEKIYQRFRDGHTLVVNGLNERWEPLARMARTLRAEAGFETQVNIYLTPGGNRGFAAHYDTHDVFIAQAHGSKTWRIYQGPIELPAASQKWDRAMGVPEEPLAEFTLRAGDVLYLPRGTIHQGAANEETSMHITVGVHPTLWSTVLRRAVTEVLDQDVEFRKGLPMGYTHDKEARLRTEQAVSALIDKLQAMLHAQDIVGESVRRDTVHTRYSALGGQLLDLQRIGTVGEDTAVRRREGVHVLTTYGEQVVALAFHGKTVEFPSHVSQEVRYITESTGAAFTPADITGRLDAPGRVLLVETLIREGFLTFA